jgi:hypothetical protein
VPARFEVLQVFSPRDRKILPFSLDWFWIPLHNAALEFPEGRSPGTDHFLNAILPQLKFVVFAKRHPCIGQTKLYPVTGVGWSHPANVGLASADRRIPRREFMEETYRDASVSNSPESAGGGFGLRHGIATSVDAG